MIKKYEEPYFQNLCSLITGPIKTESYLTLLKRLYVTPFISTLDGDNNRIQDVRFLRQTLCTDNIILKDFDLQRLREPSVLEVFWNLASSISFFVEKSTKNPSVYFWKILDNLQLTNYDNFNYSKKHVDVILEIFLYRKYTQDGIGSAFPLYKNSSRDMRNTELWYQMQEYIINGDI